jgi:hypothetical protein
VVRAGISLKSPLLKRGHNLRGVPEATATFVYECLRFKVAVATTGTVFDSRIGKPVLR